MRSFIVMLNIARLPLHLERYPSRFLFIFYIKCVNIFSENSFLWLPYNTSFQCMILDLNIARMNSSTPAMRDVQFLQLEIQQIMKGGSYIFCISNIFVCYFVININHFMFTWTVRHFLVLTFGLLSFPSGIPFLWSTKLHSPEQMFCI